MQNDEGWHEFKANHEVDLWLLDSKKKKLKLYADANIPKLLIDEL